MSESSFTYHGLQASGLARRLQLFASNRLCYSEHVHFLFAIADNTTENTPAPMDVDDEATPQGKSEKGEASVSALIVIY